MKSWFFINLVYVLFYFITYKCITKKNCKQAAKASNQLYKLVGFTHLIVKQYLIDDLILISIIIIYYLKLLTCTWVLFT
jgi:hypothetical protein